MVSRQQKFIGNDLKSFFYTTYEHIRNFAIDDYKVLLYLLNNVSSEALKFKDSSTVETILSEIKDVDVNEMQRIWLRSNVTKNYSNSSTFRIRESAFRCVKFI